MGMLDRLNDPMTMGLLSAAGALLQPKRVGIGDGLMAFAQGGLGAQDRQSQRKKDEMAQTMALLQLQELQRQIQQRATDERLTREQFTPNYPLGASVMPRLEGPARPQPTMPQFDPRELISKGASPAAVQTMQGLMPQPKSPLVTKPGDVLRDPSDPTKILAQNPTEEKLDALIIRGPDGQPMINPLALEARKQIGAAGATQVNFGTPQPAVNPRTGRVELVRPDNRGGMNFTGIEPPPQNRDVKAPAEIQRMNIAIDTMDSLLNDYESFLKQYNPRDPTVQMNPALRAEMESKHKNLMLQFKEVQALGALAGPDLSIMEGALTSPFTLRGAFYGKSGLLGQVAEARKLLSIRKSATTANIGQRGKQAEQPTDQPTPSVDELLRKYATQ